MVEAMTSARALEAQVMGGAVGDAERAAVAAKLAA